MKFTALLHKTAALCALLTIASFWLSTVISELFLSQYAVMLVKNSIVMFGLAFLIFSMIITGITGNILSKTSSSNEIAKKKKRMPILILNGLLLMIPLSIFLNMKAQKGEFDQSFIFLQVLELAIGMLQIILMLQQIFSGKKIKYSRQSQQSSNHINTDEQAVAAGNNE